MFAANDRVCITTACSRYTSESACATAAGSAECPAAVVLTIDLTPSPGLRGPTDFFGRADHTLLAEVDAAMLKLDAHNQ